MLETFIESQIYNQITIDGLNSITSVTFARRLYDFGHANLCLNLLMMSMLIWKKFFFQVKRTMDVHIKSCAISDGRSCTCVTIPFHKICDFHVVSR